MPTTIQISEELQRELVKKKLYDKETYEEVIWDLMEDTQELSAQTKRELTQARKEIEKGKTRTLDEVKEELDL